MLVKGAIVTHLNQLVNCTRTTMRINCILEQIDGQRKLQSVIEFRQ